MTFEEKIDKDDFINNYNRLKSSAKMSELYGVSKGTIQDYSKKIGYVNNYRFKITEKQKQYVINNYYTKKAITLVNELGCSKSLITKTWKNAGLSGKQSRTYYVNEDFFETIDTPNKAYILGYIASDGCVYKRDGHIDMLCFGCEENDRELLEIVNKEMDSEYKIDDKCYRTLKSGEVHNYLSLQINSDKICNDLSKYNIIPRKTWNYKPINLKNDKLTWHFIRGYFDGDGSIYYSPNLSGAITPSSYRVSIICNKETTQWFYDFFKHCGLSPYIHKDNRKDKYNGEIYTIVIRRCKDIEFVFNKMYLDSNELRLKRKYNKFKDFIKIYQLSK